ncbi:MAG: M23 family metallopeptidase [Alphaproteobacteria bacterium]|nr:M23 family metallopeptidase [Alphaproteobacteria bacterium]
MIARRDLLALGAIGWMLPAWADDPLLAVPAAAEQGKLVVGRSRAGAQVRVDGEPVEVGADGAFTFGIAYDRTGSAQIEARSGSRLAHRQVDIMPRIYEVQRINGLPENEVSPPPQVLQRIHDEALAIAQARTRTTDAVWFAGGLDWPVAGIVTSVYGSQRVLDGQPRAPHLGIDIAAPAGTPIRAPADGVVSLIGSDYVLDGNLTLLDHGQGVSTCYVHQSVIAVKLGEHVRRGQRIGTIGVTGRATGPNLHWGLNWFQVKLDPSLSTPTPLPPRA